MDPRLHLAKEIAFAGRCRHDSSADAEDYWEHTLTEGRETHLKQAKGAITAIQSMMPKLEWREVDDDHFAATCPFTGMGFECRQGVRGPVRIRSSIINEWMEAKVSSLEEAKADFEKVHQDQLLAAVGLSVDPSDDQEAS